MGDRDWFRLELQAGQTVTISLNGTGASPVSDTYLRLRDGNGTLISEDDDGGPGYNSRLTFTPTASGTYFIDVGAWNDQGAGTYSLTVVAGSIAPTAPLWSLDQIANQLVNGFWDGEWREFGVSQGGSLLVNITGLTQAGQFFARNALSLWSDVIGVRFVEVTSGGQIVFDDDQEGAFSSSSVIGNTIMSSRVNISSDWIANDGRNLNSYSFQTYVHEIGHALGLGHAGDYNDQADYLADALYRNDSWSTTIMSYFDQQENHYFRDQGFTFNYVLTPMLGDILAMSLLYGLSTTTRTGDTTYGFGSTAGRAVFDATQYAAAAYTIFDSGGNDTLDYSGYSANQLINLNSGVFSNVGGDIGNVAIAVGTTIENAVGGSGNDQLIGNAADNRLAGGAGLDVLDGGAGADILSGGDGSDILTGGSGLDTLAGGDGADIFRDTAAGLNGDFLPDFSSVDRVVITDAVLAGFSVAVSGNVLSFSGGSVVLGSVPSGRLVVSSADSGGVQILVGRDARHDFNGDGRSDLFWRHASGEFVSWSGQANGGYLYNGVSANRIDSSWSVIGLGDYNGDGRDDIMWRHVGGELAQWLGQANGSLVHNGGAAWRIDTNWRVVGTGDFNGDGHDDLVWRHVGGEFAHWLGQSDGSFLHSGKAANPVGTDWSIVGTGDFNGDGRDDILWRHDGGSFAQWIGLADATFANNAAGAFFIDPANRTNAVGDFDGDGRSDLLLRDASGNLLQWRGQSSGGFVQSSAVTNQLPLAWQIAQVGDFNGDGRDDILWRHTSGELAQWSGQANGAFLHNAAGYANIDMGWAIQSPDVALL